jgi:hypothetical protein
VEQLAWAFCCSSCSCSCWGLSMEFNELYAFILRYITALDHTHKTHTHIERRVQRNVHVDAMLCTASLTLTLHDGERCPSSPELV